MAVSKEEVSMEEMSMEGMSREEWVFEVEKLLETEVEVVVVDKRLVEKEVEVDKLLERVVEVVEVVVVVAVDKLVDKSVVEVDKLLETVVEVAGVDKQLVDKEVAADIESELAAAVDIELEWVAVVDIELVETVAEEGKWLEMAVGRLVGSWLESLLEKESEELDQHTAVELKLGRKRGKKISIDCPGQIKRE